MPREKTGGRTVYTTEQGNLCPECRRPLPDCSCRKAAAKPPSGDPDVRIRRETKGRKGKGVTVVENVPLDEPELKKLAKELKAKCGSGGTVKEGRIEIQGDRREILQAELAKKGWKAKLAGG